MEIKWIDTQYHVQYNADVAQQDVKMYFKNINSQHYHFMVHIPDLMEQGG